MKNIRVLKDSSKRCIVIDGMPFNLDDLMAVISEKLIYGTTVCDNGRVFHSYHHAPLYYSGSPYGDFMKGFIEPMKEIPDGFSPEWVPHDGVMPPKCSLKWADMLGLDPYLHWYATERK